MPLAALNSAHWREGLDCSICGSPITALQSCNWDHDPPRSRGGRGRRDRNLAHCLCNAVKGDQHPFSLRTPEQRAAIATRVTARTYRRLQRIWAGEAG